jgi:2-polyprenyl-3-methyl-5-hydroxy-6-metoxy-1,4-benzoquinol methylase
MIEKRIEWSQLFSSRERIHRRYRSIWDIPLIRNRSHLLARVLKNGMSLLDVGAGTKGMAEEIKKAGFTINYKSLDPDKSIEHDFHDISEVNESFDVVALFEVIEHLSLDQGFDLLQTLKGKLNDGGLILLSTPNVFNPSRFFRDATHKTFYAYDELAGMVEMAGYEVQKLYRQFNDAFHRYILKVYFLSPLFRLLSIDYAYSIYVVGMKK